MSSKHDLKSDLETLKTNVDGYITERSAGTFEPSNNTSDSFLHDIQSHLKQWIDGINDI